MLHSYSICDRVAGGIFKSLVCIAQCQTEGAEAQQEMFAGLPSEAKGLAGAVEGNGGETLQ
jgi:hypothetical protein